MSAVFVLSSRAASAGCGVSSVSARRLAQALRKSALSASRFQRIGIEHARDVAGERGTDQGFGALALADAGPGDERVELLAERVVRVAAA